MPIVGDLVVNIVDDEAAAAASAQAKRAALQRKAAAAMVAAEDYARRFESGDLAVRFFEFGPNFVFFRYFCGCLSRFWKLFDVVELKI